MTFQQARDAGRSRRAWDPRLTAAELLDLGGRNLVAFVIQTAGFLELHGISPETWAAHLGAEAAAALGPHEPWDADEFMAAMLVNYVAAGAVVIDAALDRDYARAVIGNLPPPALCRELGAPLSVMDCLHEMPAPIAAAGGLRWSWRRAGREVILTASRVPPPPGATGSSAACAAEPGA
ncbi:MAG: hypothetical protein ACKOWF_12725 [Chloroflexota bacterium]